MFTGSFSTQQMRHLIFSGLLKAPCFNQSSIKKQFQEEAVFHESRNHVPRGNECSSATEQQGAMCPFGVICIM